MRKCKTLHKVIKAKHIMFDIDDISDWKLLCQHFGFEWDHTHRKAKKTETKKHKYSFVRVQKLIANLK